MSLFDLSGHAALVTGSSRGIGRGIADGLHEAGANVIYQSFSKPAEGLPEGAVCLQSDLSQPDAPFELINQAFEQAPNLDTLVCNAGSFYDTTFLDMTSERWAQTMDLNVRAPYFLIQSFTKRLVEEKRAGSVIIIGSTNGFQAEYESTAYDTSKGALVMMTRSLALNLADYGIRVNSIAPGLIRTPLTSWLDNDHATRTHYEKNIPLHRIGNLEDCAGAAVFLSSAAASYITGHVIVVDGGLTLSQIDKP
jgi:NAD(P)-dependent dehydrogenase (short-subunit alcohol dehydrogenase family)